jgi:protein TonB
MRSSLVSLTLHVVVYRAPPPPIVDRGPHVGTGRVYLCEPAPPTFVPPTIPDVDVSRTLPSTGVGTRIVETWDGPSHEGSHGGEPTPNSVLSSDVVDVQVMPYAGGPTPRYPEALREAGVEGQVTLEFVVDTTGRVEGGSVRVLSSAADAFVVSVRDALAGTRYHPALVGGRRVRQLVRQGFVFSLTQH